MGKIYRLRQIMREWLTINSRHTTCPKDILLEDGDMGIYIWSCRNCAALFPEMPPTSVGTEHCPCMFFKSKDTPDNWVDIRVSLALAGSLKDSLKGWYEI